MPEVNVVPEMTGTDPKPGYGVRPSGLPGMTCRTHLLMTEYMFNVL